VGAVHVEGILVLARSRSSSGRRLPLPSGREVRYRLDEVHLGPRLAVAAEGAGGNRE